MVPHPSKKGRAELPPDDQTRMLVGVPQTQVDEHELSESDSHTTRIVDELNADESTMIVVGSHSRETKNVTTCTREDSLAGWVMVRVRLRVCVSDGCRECVHVCGTL